MSVFTEKELAYLHSKPGLAHIATVGRNGMPHVVPTGWSYNGTDDTLDVGGIDLTNTKKYRDIARSGMVAIVIDDVLPPWRPRGIEVRGRAETLPEPDAVIRIHPSRIVSWGIDGDERWARDVDPHQ